LSSVTGIGLAAPQISGNKRMFCIWIKPTKKSPDLVDTGPQIIINPEIISFSDTQVSILE
jgi:peptide deformylase